MAHIGLGQLLEAFRIDEAADYYLLKPGEQSVFLTRLYSELEDHAREGLSLLELDRGLKLHFVVEADGQGGFRNLPDDVFFRKICFYASKTVVTFPFRETLRSPREIVRHGYATEIKRDKEIVAFGKYRAGRDGYGGRIDEVRKTHHLYRAELDTFLHLLCSARPFLDSGFLTIVPTFYPEAKKLRLHTKSALGLSPANFKSSDLRRQFEEEGFERLSKIGTPVLYLPYFNNLSAQEVLQVRKEEADRYVPFQIQLGKLVRELPQSTSEKEMLALMADVDTELRKINAHFEAIEKTARRNGGRFAVGVAVAAMGLLSPPAWVVPVVQAVRTILGKDDYTFFRYLEGKRALDAQKSAIAGDEFYLFWRLEDPRRHPKLEPALPPLAAVK